MDVRSETLRYLGYKGEPDPQTKELLDLAERELQKTVKPAFCWKVFKKADCGSILTGRDIENHLRNSDRIILFAATLGVSADRIIRTAEIGNMAYALVLDAYASAVIEEFCDNCEKEMKEKTGGFYTTRFSPGYGDYPVSLQSEFIRILSADKLAGLTATENHILVPRKSVTAVIGISDYEQTETGNKCDNCNMRNTCRFRKEGKNCGHKNTFES